MKKSLRTVVLAILTATLVGATIPLESVKGDLPAFNVDPNFNLPTSSYHYYDSLWYAGPWGSNDWGVSAYQWGTNDISCPGPYPVQEVIFSTSPGNAYAWLHAQTQCVGPPSVGVVRYVQGVNEGGGSWYDPGPKPVTPWEAGTILLSYSLTRQNSAFDDPPKAAENGVLFDLKLNNIKLKKPVLIDLYLNQGCQSLAYLTCFSKQVGFLGCNEPNDVHVQIWRIHADFSDNEWISANGYDLTSIIETSVNQAWNVDSAGGACNHGGDYILPGTTYLNQLQVVAEAFNAEEGTLASSVSLTINPLTCSPSASPTSGSYGITVQFNANCQGGFPPYKYSWVYDDGSSCNDCVSNPTHPYYANGYGWWYYFPSLTVTDSYLYSPILNPPLPRISVWGGSPCPGNRVC